MTTLTLYVKDKILSNTESFKCECQFVACNTSYNIQFKFDEEWSGLRKKARLMYKSNDGKRLSKDLAVDDNDATCEIPYELIPHKGILYIGVYADNIAATNTVRFWIRESTKDLGSTRDNTYLPGVAWHDHENLDALDDMSTDGSRLFYGGKQVVDERTLSVVNEYEALYELDSDVLLAYVAQPRRAREPIKLEAGTTYGGDVAGVDRQKLYIDPRMPNFFPCEAFSIRTVPYDTSPNEPDSGEAYYEFVTDGITYFCINYYKDDILQNTKVFNNTDKPITIGGIEYPAKNEKVGQLLGWSRFSHVVTDNEDMPPPSDDDGPTFEIEPDVDGGITLMSTDSGVDRKPSIITTENDYGNFNISTTPITFGTDEHFEDLEKIMSARDTFSYVKGLYQRSGSGSSWTSIDSSDFSITLNSVAAASHTHGNKGILDKITEDSFNNGLVSAYINDNGELIIEIGGGIVDARINEYGELEVDIE